jgi:hypothetical protein
VPPAPVGRSAEQVRCHAVEVRDAPADAEDKGQQPRPRQVGDQAFQLLAGSLVYAVVPISHSSPRAGAVSGGAWASTLRSGDLRDLAEGCLSWQ